MRKHYSDETKNQTVQEFINGKSVSKIHAETGISRSTIYSWIESQKATFTKSEKINLRDYRELVTKCERQQKIIQKYIIICNLQLILIIMGLTLNNIMI